MYEQYDEYGINRGEEYEKDWGSVLGGHPFLLGKDHCYKVSSLKYVNLTQKKTVVLEKPFDKVFVPRM